ncbi:MAG: hypothetical protein K2Y21_11425 [Phycisphaerales bacterium]|nr:hypothetical protein [Phycisphaerales bacterium]
MRSGFAPYAATVLAATTLTACLLLGCEQQGPSQTQLAKEPSTNSAPPPTTQAPTTRARALILRHRGPSDRPPPVLIFSPTQADANQAAKDESAHSLMGATPIVMDAASFARLIDALPEAKGNPTLLELELCGDQPRRILLGGEESIRWIDSCKDRVGETSAAWGYLRSTRASLTVR